MDQPKEISKGARINLWLLKPGNAFKAFGILFTLLVLYLAGCGPQNRCLVSPLTGTVIANGKPVIGATVTRRFHSLYYEKQVEAATKTDAQGLFAFAGVWKWAPINILHQPVIEEEVTIEYNGKAYTALKCTKMDYKNLGEFDAVQFDAMRDRDPSLAKPRLSKQEGKLYLKCDLDSLPFRKPQ
jgi:hypothetical protein